MFSIDTAFITGTGFYSLKDMRILETQLVDTPYGNVKVQIAKINENTVAFIPRHGSSHSLAPSQINFRANIFALHLLGVRRILSTSVCGSTVTAYPPGSLVLIDQFINFSAGRIDTFYPLDGKLCHVDVTDPYCSTLHSQLLEAAGQENIFLAKGATYGCYDGPRFETRAEIEMSTILGIHLVGQTNYPEVVLARELAICYATVGFVSNMAAGLAGTLTVTEVMQTVKDSGDRIARLFGAWIESFPKVEECTCHHALDQAGF